MTDWRRRLYDSAVLDRAAALILAPFIVALLALLVPVLLFVQGRPVFHASERMRGPGVSFTLWKLRSMTGRGGDDAVLGGDLSARITPAGRVLRRLRLDELPQVFNILRGDMRFIGPRPPLPRYVEAYPELYARVLETRPGITGLATALVHAREERLLSRCATREETDRVYRRACIPLKARLDLLYARRRSLALDLLILRRTFAGLSLGRARPARHIVHEPAAGPVARRAA